MKERPIKVPLKEIQEKIKENKDVKNV